MELNKQLTKKMESMFQQDLQFTGGASHCHSQNSVDDGFQSEADICKTAKELGAKAAFISDHGTAMGWDDFDDAAKKIGIKPIFGVEAYYLDEEMEKPSHLILYAKNNEGMQAICMAMARGKIIEDGRCCLTDETLEYLRGGNIIATSACIQGPLGSIVLHNNSIKRKIDKVEAELAAMESDLERYEIAKKQYDDVCDQYAVLKAEVSEAKAASKKSFSGKQKQLEGMGKKLEKANAAFNKFLEDGKPASAKSVIVALAQMEIKVESPDDFQEGLDAAQTKYNQKAAQLKAEIAQTKNLADTLAAKNASLDKLAEEKAAAKSALDAVSKHAAKAETKQTKIEELKASMLTSEQQKKLYNKRLAKMLDVFKGNFYIEVQYHGIEAEKTIYPWVAKVARKHHIPLIAANDAHVTRNLAEDFKGRQIRRSCRYKKWETEIDGDEELYIKNDRELALALYQILQEDVVIEAMQNVSKVVDMCNATIIKEPHAPKSKVANVKDEIIKIAKSNISKKYGDKWDKAHQDRFDYEIEIIDKMGFNDYFYNTWDILNVARKIGGLSYDKLDELKNVMDDLSLDEMMDFLDKYSTEANLSVGLGRGSGAGSIVCYLLGITNIDPLKYDLLFERFLNPERISMPEQYRAFNVNPITQGCAA